MVVMFGVMCVMLKLRLIIHLLMCVVVMFVMALCLGIMRGGSDVSRNDFYNWAQPGVKHWAQPKGFGLVVGLF